MQGLAALTPQSVRFHRRRVELDELLVVLGVGLSTFRDVNDIRRAVPRADYSGGPRVATLYDHDRWAADSRYR
jgi:hypothetical protein